MPYQGILACFGFVALKGSYREQEWVGKEQLLQDGDSWYFAFKILISLKGFLLGLNNLEKKMNKHVPSL